MKFLLLVLKLVEAVVNAAQGEKFLMRALFAQPPLVEDENAVGVLDGAQAVRDHHGGAALRADGRAPRGSELGLGVHARCRFVEDQKFGVVRQRAREADELALADRKGRAALGDGRFDALRQGTEKWAESDFAQARARWWRGRCFRAEAHVRFQRAGKKKRILQHDAEKVPQILEIDFANVHAIEQNLAALNIVEAQQELDDGGLAGAGMADDGERMPGLDAEGNVAQNPVFFFRSCAAVVGEPDIAELDFAPRLGQRARALLAKKW